MEFEDSGIDLHIPNHMIENNIFNQDEISLIDSQISQHTIVVQPYSNSNLVSNSYIDQDEDFEDKEMEIGIDPDRVINQEEIQIMQDELICPICQHIVVQPVSCKSCEGFFCNACAYQWTQKAKDSRDCPCCRGYGVSQLYNQYNYENFYCFYTETIPKLFLKTLSKIKLSCKYQHRGCEDILGYDSIDKHENDCDFQLILCENFGCGEQMLKKEQEKHQETCPFHRVECPNQQCLALIQRQELDFHMQTCNYRLEECKFCKVSQYAIDLAQHQLVCDFQQLTCRRCKKVLFFLDYKAHTEAICYRDLYFKSQEDSQLIHQEISKLKQENMQIKKNCLYLSQELLKYKKTSANLQKIHKNEQGFENKENAIQNRIIDEKLKELNEQYQFQDEDQEYSEDFESLAEENSVNNNYINGNNQQLINSQGQNQNQDQDQDQSTILQSKLYKDIEEFDEDNFKETLELNNIILPYNIPVDKSRLKNKIQRQKDLQSLIDKGLKQEQQQEVNKDNEQQLYSSDFQKKDKNGENCDNQQKCISQSQDLFKKKENCMFDEIISPLLIQKAYSVKEKQQLNMVNTMKQIKISEQNQLKLDSLINNFLDQKSLKSEDISKSQQSKSSFLQNSQNNQMKKQNNIELNNDEEEDEEEKQIDLQEKQENYLNNSGKESDDIYNLDQFDENTINELLQDTSNQQDIFQNNFSSDIYTKLQYEDVMNNNDQNINNNELLQNEQQKQDDKDKIKKNRQDKDQDKDKFEQIIKENYKILERLEKNQELFKWKII